MNILNHHFGSGKSNTTGSMLLLAIAAVGMCQTTLAQEGDPESPKAVDEGIVKGSKSLLTLRQDVDVAEANFFAVFNSFNRDAIYDVHCDYRVILGSRRRSHDCKAAFQRDYEAALALGNNDSFSGIGERPPPSESRMKKQQKKFQKKIGNAVAEHPELLEALNEFANTKRVLEAERNKR